ncbi:MAG: dihydroorotate dehydrogenase electron transfer subunit, partial [candidate division NC10 bacterium]|nr:dihydroorotate dehydrogenase electron transfer subunit [candidate division NC10 bacterium]
CMGCAIPVKPSAISHQPSASYKLCCKDGPVFDAGEIAW